MSEDSLIKGRPVIQFKVEDLVPYENNAKIHTDKDVAVIVESIRRFGFNSSIWVDKNNVIVAGHGRRLAAISLGMTYVPTIVLDDLTDDQIKAARLVDNKSVGVNFDYELEQQELESLVVDADFDMTGMGYEDNELDFLTADLAEMDLSSVIDDLDTEVKEHTEKAEAKAKEIEAGEVPLGEAFGFKRVTVDMARMIGKFMGRLEDETGEKGHVAFNSFMTNLVGD
ncbi:MAG: ParB N-terminal domain-containing protein [Piscirickettsiaceae bacterium]|nr:ParB N-terminal domain-containing protein [Piscirickettsiaceae bacterium]